MSNTAGKPQFFKGTLYTPQVSAAAQDYEARDTTYRALMDYADPDQFVEIP